MNKEPVGITTVTPVPNRTFKSTIFSMLFSEKKELLALYNAVNNTNYSNPSELTITTLNNSIYMSIKNDVSCLVDLHLNMYEHQSTVNPNIPLRDLDYVARSYSSLARDQDIYAPKLIRLPNPKFIVFYNGKDEQPAVREMKLSDAYYHQENNPSLELVVTQININHGYNDELLNKCQTLKEYMLYVDLVRTYQSEMSLTEAVTKAVDECIRGGILADFLKKNKAEAISMSLFEYDEKLHEKTMRDIGREEGLQQGLQHGIVGTITALKAVGTEENVIIEQLVKVYGITNEEAREIIDKDE